MANIVTLKRNAALKLRTKKGSVVLTFVELEKMVEIQRQLGLIRGDDGPALAQDEPVPGPDPAYDPPAIYMLPADENDADSNAAVIAEAVEAGGLLHADQVAKLFKPQSKLGAALAAMVDDEVSYEDGDEDEDEGGDEDGDEDEDDFEK